MVSARLTDTGKSTQRHSLSCSTRGDYHFYVASQVTNLLQLAIALVMDLELNRPPRNAGFLPGNLVEEVAKARGVYRGRPPHTLADIRALLGCFYISTL